MSGIDATPTSCLDEFMLSAFFCASAQCDRTLGGTDLDGDQTTKLTAAFWAASVSLLRDCCATDLLPSHYWLDGSFDAKPDIEHIRRCGKQINVNLESAIFDCSLHEDLELQQREKPQKPMVNLFFFAYAFRWTSPASLATAFNAYL